MKFHTVNLSRKDVGYVIPIGDIHLGSTSFGEKGRTLLKGYLDWVKDHKEACIVLMGDLFDVATRASATAPFESSSTEYRTAVDLFKPYAKKIVASIRGNHCQRLLNYAGYDPMEQFAAQLGIPYMGL